MEETGTKELVRVRSKIFGCFVGRRDTAGAAIGPPCF
jgi:hypothetical protein